METALNTANRFSPFKIFTRIALALFFLAPSAQSARAQERHELAPGLTVGGSLRTRLEYKYDFKFGSEASGNTDNYFLSQIRLNLKWDVLDTLSFYVEGQDADIQGDDSIDENATPNIYSDRFDLHQGYLDFSLPSEMTHVAFRLGRQKLKYGSERLVGPLEWVNTARVFDAAKLTLGTPTTRSADIFASRAVPVDPDNFNSWGPTANRYANGELYGIYYTDNAVITSSVLELYYLLRHEGEVDDSVHTFGTRYVLKLDPWDLDADFSYQTGRFGGLDHSALAAHIGAGLLLCTSTSTHLGMAYNYASGDDDASDSKHGTFDNLYPTNHAFYGYMDLFSLQNLHNLELTVSQQPIEDLELRAAWQNFWLAEPDSDSWYNAGLGTVRTPSGAHSDSYVGSEIDLTASYPIWKKKLNFLVGYSHFFTGGYVEDTGSSSDADFVYAQAKLSL